MKEQEREKSKSKAKFMNTQAQLKLQQEVYTSLGELEDDDTDTAPIYYQGLVDERIGPLNQ